MNNYFEIDEKEIQEFKQYFENYKTDKNYDKDLDIKYDLKITKKESTGRTEKKIKTGREQEELVCQKNCKKCKRTIEKVLNLLENNCGKIKRKDKVVSIKIPKGIKDNQSIVLIGEGRKENNKYGNLIVTIKVK